EHFVYDSEPPCRAVVTMRAMDPTRELAFMSRVQSAFYAQNRDITSGEVLADMAAEEGQDRAAFEDLFQSTDIRNATFRDFLTAQEMGIRGFPALIVGSKRAGYALVTNGFRPLDGLPEAIETWLGQHQATP